MTEEVQKSLRTPVDENENFVVIPPEDSAPGGVPICIRTVDDHGRRVYRGWIDAVRPIATPLRILAKTVIHDIWRVSELAEGSVHALSAKHGERLGRSPSSRIYVHAKWRAQDLAAGGYRNRARLDVELRDHMLAALREPYDFANAFEDSEFIDRLEQRLRERGETDLVRMIELIRYEAEDQIPEVFGVKGKRERNNLAQRLHRVLQKARQILLVQHDSKRSA